MPVTVVVGGQFGSEGKGKVAHFFARSQNASVAVRVGGSKRMSEKFKTRLIVSA
jgi:adenylosuccinate synthase